LTIAYVALGGNEGERLANLERAVSEMAVQLTVTMLSPLYETKPVGFADQGWFLNAVAAVETELSPHELLALLQAVEQTLGKATPFPNGPRTLDLDLLLYGDEIVNDEGLVVPHPRLHQRAFVLQPLADLAGDVNHPTLGKRIRQLLGEVSDQSGVRAWEGRSGVFPAHRKG
jgi:2-amino-4-hydroxy-6-hydroxymethyldihydropteridine diphosphokinase